MAINKVKNFQEEFSLEDIGVAREVRATYNCGMSRIALRAPDQIYKIGRQLMKEPESAHAHVNQITLKMHYAIQVWCKAALISADSRDNLSDYWRLHWTQGEGAFNTIEYHDFHRDITVEQILKKFWDLLEQIANSGEIQVCEGYHIRCDGEGYSEPNIVCDMIVDAPTAKEIEFEDVYTYPYNKTLVSYKWDEIKNLFVELTLNQLRLTMPDKLHNHTELDDQLLKACRDWDIDTIKHCMAKGTNINCLDERGESVLQCAVEWFARHDMLLDKNYTREEYEALANKNEKMCKEVVDLLLSYGADINLFGFKGMSPLICAYYENSVSMIKYLLDKGADPNTNCYLEDIQYWPMLKNIRCTILRCISDLLPEECDDTASEIEKIIRNAGGREFVWDYTPWNYENIGKIVVCVYPSREGNQLFCDNSDWCIGTDKEITIEDKDGKQTIIDISSVDGLKQWNLDFQNNLTNPSYNWKAWKERGMELSKKVAELLPENVALFYLRDNEEVVTTYGASNVYLSHKGDFIRIK